MLLLSGMSSYRDKLLNYAYLGLIAVFVDCTG